MPALKRATIPGPTRPRWGHGPLHICKTERVHRQRPWRNMQDLAMASLGWIDRFNNRRLPGPIGTIPPAEAEQTFHAQRDLPDMVA